MEVVKANGSTCAFYGKDSLIFLNDWEKFSTIFINTGN